MLEKILLPLVVSLLGGAGAAGLIWRGLMDRLRERFVEKELFLATLKDLVSKLDLEATHRVRDNELDEILEKTEHRIIDRVNATIGSLDNRIMQRHDSLVASMNENRNIIDRALTVAEKATARAENAEKSAVNAEHKAEKAQMTVDSVKEAMDARLGNIETLMRAILANQKVG